MDHIELSKELIAFVDQSTSMFHSVHTIEEELKKAGLHQLQEGEPWDLKEGHGYYVSRNNSSVIAFKIP